MVLAPERERYASHTGRPGARWDRLPPPVSRHYYPVNCLFCRTTGLVTSWCNSVGGDHASERRALQRLLMKNASPGSALHVFLLTLLCLTLLAGPLAAAVGIVA